MQLTSGLVDPADVVVVGSGPTGLMLACELALGGAKPRRLLRSAVIGAVTGVTGVNGYRIAPSWPRPSIDRRC